MFDEKHIVNLLEMIRIFINAIFLGYVWNLWLCSYGVVQCNKNNFNNIKTKNKCNVRVLFKYYLSMYVCKRIVYVLKFVNVCICPHA